MKDKTISLVLGSGGARGLAHIGVIKYLSEQQYKIGSIVGCSIGALVGGVYAGGKIDELEEWMLNLKKTDMVKLMDFSWGMNGFIKGDKVISELEAFIGNKDIEDLDIPFTAIAADIKTEKEVWICSGGLFEAIRASVSLPLFLTPVSKDGKLLIDGGVLNPIPIAPAFKDGFDTIVAVNLGGVPDPDIHTAEKQRSIQPNQDEGLFRKISTYISNIIDSKKKAGEEEEGYGMYDIADRAFDIMQNAIARQKLAAYTPDVLIEIPRNACGTLEFDKAEEMIKMGYDKAKKAFSDNSEQSN